MSSRPDPNNNAVRDSTSPGYGSDRIYANITINGKAAGRWMFDTGADISIMSSGLAKQIGLDTSRNAGSLNLIGVGSNRAAPLIDVQMQIENQPAFTTRIAVANSNFNLISKSDMTKVYDVNITAGGAKLSPKGSTSQAAPINTLPQPELTTLPQLQSFQFTPENTQLLIIAVMFVIILGVLA